MSEECVHLANKKPNEKKFYERIVIKGTEPVAFQALSCYNSATDLIGDYFEQIVSLDNFDPRKEVCSEARCQEKLAPWQKSDEKRILKNFLEGSFHCPVCEKNGIIIKKGNQYICDKCSFHICKCGEYRRRCWIEIQTENFTVKKYWQ